MLNFVFGGLHYDAIQKPEAHVNNIKASVLISVNKYSLLCHKQQILCREIIASGCENHTVVGHSVMFVYKSDITIRRLSFVTKQT
jgi:hypothetical protein